MTLGSEVVHLRNESVRSSFCPTSERRKGRGEPEDFRLFPETLAEHFGQHTINSRRERDQGFLAESLEGEADGPADMPHNVLETATLLIIPLFQQTFNLGRLHRISSFFSFFLS